MLDTDLREEAVNAGESGLSIVDVSLFDWSVLKGFDADGGRHGMERRSDTITI